MYVLEIRNSTLKTKFGKSAQMLGKLTQALIAQTLIVCGDGASVHSLLVCPENMNGRIWTVYPVAARRTDTTQQINIWSTIMKNENDQARVPAENYRARARAVLNHILMQMKGLADPDRWREPTEAEMEIFVQHFHEIMNWTLDGARSVGYPVPHFPGPLTEAEMRHVESRLLTDVTIARFPGGGFIVSRKRTA